MPAASTYKLSVQVLDFESICPLIQLARLICDFCSSSQRFACDFLQIPPRDGHPCRPANDSPCRVRRRLSLPSECALPGAPKKKAAVTGSLYSQPNTQLGPNGSKLEDKLRPHCNSSSTIHAKGIGIVQELCCEGFGKRSRAGSDTTNVDLPVIEDVICFRADLEVVSTFLTETGILYEIHVCVVERTRAVCVSGSEAGSAVGNACCEVSRLHPGGIWIDGDNAGGSIERARNICPNVRIRRASHWNPCNNST